MNPLNALKKWLLNLLIPYIENTDRKNDISKDQSFKMLFKKRKSIIIISVLISFLIVFGVGKSFSIIAWAIALSPFIVIFWNTFGDI